MTLPDSILQRLSREPEIPSREKLRQELQRHVDHYLSRGGAIEQVGSEANYAARQPVKRTRKQQVEHERKFFRARS